MFKRELDPKAINSLSNSRLFIEKLSPDIKKGEVFPAIRNGYIEFYYAGGCLFSFKNKFSTNIKYASVFKKTGSGDYISEDKLMHTDKINNFIEGYERIKENCSHYAKEEAMGVSSIYSKYSYANNKATDIVVLDIEVSFKSLIPEKELNKDRIDLLIFNKDNKTLRFYEAKHYSNPEIWSRANTKPKVAKQIQKYNDQIKENESDILHQYSHYIDITNSLFDLKLTKPNHINKDVVLLIFGFDRDQLKGRFSSLLKNDHSLDEINYYAIGDASDVIIKNMWQQLK